LPRDTAPASIRAGGIAVLPAHPKTFVTILINNCFTIAARAVKPLAVLVPNASLRARQITTLDASNAYHSGFTTKSVLILLAGSILAGIINGTCSIDASAAWKGTILVCLAGFQEVRHATVHRVAGEAVRARRIPGFFTKVSSANLFNVLVVLAPWLRAINVFQAGKLSPPHRHAAKIWHALFAILHQAGSIHKLYALFVFALITTIGIAFTPGRRAVQVPVAFVHRTRAPDG